MLLFRNCISVHRTGIGQRVGPLQIGLRLSRPDKLAATFSPEPDTALDVTIDPGLLFVGIRVPGPGPGTRIAMTTLHLRTLLALDIFNFWTFRL
jgi:hypothetical protein